MFRDIRKKKNQISTEAAEQLLREARRGILAVNGREGYPYAIPINYYYDREAQKIYFHGARAGHKVEAIRACDKVCFTVYGGEKPGPDHHGTGGPEHYVHYERYHHTTGTLPVTGGNTGQLALIAGGLALLGAGFLLAERRTARTRATATQD